MLINEFDKILIEDPVRIMLEDLYELDFEIHGTNCEMAGEFYEKVYELIDKEEVGLAIHRSRVDVLIEMGFSYIGLCDTNTDNKHSLFGYTNFYIGYNKDG